MEDPARPRRPVLPWVLRAAWAVQPVVAGPAFSAAFEGRSTPVAVVGSVGLWGAWAGVLLATLLLRPVTLAVVRVLAPGAVVAAVTTVLTGRPGAGAAVAAVVATLVAAFVALLPEIGTAFVNGSAYGDERRFLLRAPGALLLGPIELAWASCLLAPAGALALAARAWVGGAVLVALGAVGVWVGGRSLYALTHRWVVLVPAGLVLKDPLTLVDPVLFRRQQVEALRPAPADTDSLDLTMGAPGLVLELLLREKVPMVLVRARERSSEEGRSARLLFTPTRPGAVLKAAAAARIPVG